MIHKIKNYLREVGSLDLRSLAVFRVGLSLIIIADLISRWRDLAAHYSDDGILPRSAAIDLFNFPFEFSIHFMSGSTWIQGLLFLIQGFFAFLLLIGYRTKLATVMSWFLMTSLHYRNTLLLYGGDNVIRVCLFWSMFLPLGRYFSVDRALNQNQDAIDRQPSYLSAASIAFILQLAIIYWSTGLLKSDPMWTQDFSAVYYALGASQLVSSIGTWLRNFPSILEAITIFTLVIECLVPFLLFLPFRQGYLRLAVVSIFVSFHLGIALTFHIGNFSYICIVFWLALLPSFFWDQLLAKRLNQNDQSTIFFDGACNYCRKIVSLIKTFMVLSHTQQLEAQAHPEIYEKMKDRNSWVVVDQTGGYHFQFEAFRYLVGISPLWKWCRPILEWSFIDRLGTKGYQWVAEHRQWLSKWTPNATNLKPIRFYLLPNLLIVFLLSYVFLWNLRTLDVEWAKKSLNPKADMIAEITGLTQNWAMFAPHPGLETGWFVIVGHLSNGKTLDIWNHREVTWDKPTSILSTYRNDRWTKVLMELSEKANEDNLSFFSVYLCRHWAGADKEKLSKIEVYFMSQLMQRDYREPTPVEKIPLWEQNCDSQNLLIEN